MEKGEPFTVVRTSSIAAFVCAYLYVFYVISIVPCVQCGGRELSFSFFGVQHIINGLPPNDGKGQKL
jgi:hypothetical protein